MRSNLFAIAAVATVLSACGQPKAEAQAPATPPATTAQAVADPAAEAFIRAQYSTTAGGTFTGDVADAAADAPIWSARTKALIAQTEALTVEGDEGFFEADPICACQDDSGMRLTSVVVTPRDADHADAAVVMTWTEAQPPETVHQTFNLIREGGAWKIDDIHGDQSGEFPQPPLLQALNTWIADAKAHPAT